MLTLTDTRGAKTCQGYTRRDFLKVGSLGMAGAMGLPGLLKARAASTGQSLSHKSVILLFLQGGPSHIELFDPKMTAPSEVRSITGEVSTKLPGITFGGTFPQLAKLADKFTVVRSYGSKNGAHTYQAVASGGNPTKATMGAMYSRIAGNTNPVTSIPSNTLVLPEAVDPSLRLKGNFETSALPTLTDPGEFGANYAAFNPIGGGELKQNMELKIPAARFDSRRELLGQLDRLKHRADATQAVSSMNQFQQQAFDVITRGVADAFDLSKEDPRLVERYDTSKLFPNRHPQAFFDMHRATNLLGKQLLLARRLCEAGCGFVTVSDCGWDMHSNGNSPKHLGGMYWLGPQVDHAVAAFIEDVEQRGLSDDILLIVTGEMGRSPRINNNGGRDHYGELTPLMFYGGGLKMGQVIGSSDPGAAHPAALPYTPENLVSTVLHTLFDVAQLRLQTELPTSLIRFAESTPPIEQLF